MANYTFIAFTLLKCNSYWTCHVHVPDEHDEYGLAKQLAKQLWKEVAKKAERLVSTQ